MKAINQSTKEVSYYNSLYVVQQHLGINAGIVKMICEKLNRCKTGVSKKDGCSYKFEYVKKEDMPDDYKKSANLRPRKVPDDHIKSANIRTKMSDEDKKKHQKESVNKWQQKEFRCQRCDKTFKNSYKYVHNKKCK